MAGQYARLPPGFALINPDTMPPASPPVSGGGPAALPQGFRLISDMPAEDLMIPGVAGDPAYEARQAEMRRRNTEAQTLERNWRESRDPMTRAADTAAFVASVPVRAVTAGNRGVGDILRALGMESAAAGFEQREQDFVRANPDVVQTLGAIGEVSAGIPALNTMGRVAPRTPNRPVSPNTEIAVRRAAEATEDMGAAQRLGVDLPGIAFNEGPVASVGKQLSETPMIGTPVKRSIEAGVRGTASAAENVASRYGDATTAQQAGQIVEEGINRFRDARPMDIIDESARTLSDVHVSEIAAAPARMSSLKTKQAVLYERAWRNIPEEMRQGRSVEGNARVMQSPATTRGVLNDIVQRNARMTQQTGRNAVEGGALMPVQGGLLGRMLDAVNNPRWTASLQTLRDMRSELRRLASGMADTEKNVLRHSDLERLQGAITQDMVALLQRNADAARQAGDMQRATGFDRAIRQFQQADRFTALSMQRLESIERMFNAPNAEALYRNIAGAALNKGRGNLEALRTLRRTLRPEEMDQLASGIIRELGSPVGSARGVAQEMNFSVQSFTTRWQNMSPEARATLFTGPHRAALDDLARVSNRLANVEALANTSRSGTNAINLGGTMAAIGAVASGAVDTMTAGLATAGGGYALSTLLSRPEYTRWLVGYLRVRARMRSATDGRVPEYAELVRRLGVMAGQDPDLEPIYEELSRGN